MIKNTLIAFLLLFSSASFAASIRVGASYFPESDSRTQLATGPAITTFGSAIAPEIAVSALLFENVEGEISASWIRSDVQFDFRDFDNSLGATDIVPISASLFHTVSASAATVYLGGGVTHVMVGDFSEEESGIRGLDLSDGTTWHAAGGVRIPFNRLAVDAGALYMPIESTFTAPRRDPLDVSIQLLMFRAGIRYTF